MLLAGRRAGLALLLLALGACERPDPLAPPTIYFGEDSCAMCGMIISDERFAAAAVDSVDGERRQAIFDDVGCLLAWEAAREEPPPARRYVRDFTTRAWLDATTAIYVHGSRIHSPMAFGVAACADRAAAERVQAEQGGDVLRLDEIRARFDAGRLHIDPGAG